MPNMPAYADRPLRIALLSYRSAPFSGGQGVYVRYLSEALARLGHRVDVLSGPPYPDLVDAVRLIRIPSLDLYANGLASLRPRHLRSAVDMIEWLGKLSGGFTEPYTFGRRVFQFLRPRLDQYDILHDNQSLSPAMLRLQRSGAALVTTIHHPITHDFRLALQDAPDWKRRLLTRRWYHFLSMQRRVARRLEHVITVSESARRDIHTELGVPSSRISVVPNGVDAAKFSPRADDGIVRDPNQIIATASSDQPLKGLRYLLEALAMLRRSRPELRLLLIGKLRPDGPNGRLLRRLRLDGAVQVLSDLSADEIAAHYARSTLAVAPSLYEGFGLPAAEAMACGVPVVCTDGGALPETVGDAGLVVPRGDAGQLAQAIETLLADPARCETLGRLGRQRALQRFSWQGAAQVAVHRYRQAIVDATKTALPSEPGAVCANG